MTTFFSVIFDNGGGTTLQTDNGFRHHYDDAAQCARDVQVLLDGGSTSDWDGNEAEHMPAVEYDYDVERNGGYMWHDEGDIRRIIQSGKLDKEFGHNSRAFYSALGVRVED